MRSPIVRPVMTALCGVTLGLSVPPPWLAAQVPLAPADSSREWQVVTGWEELFALSLRHVGAQRPPTARAPRRIVRPVLSVTLPVALAVTGGHWSVGLGREQVRTLGGRWGVGTRWQTVVSRAESRVADLTGVGVEFGVVPGRFGPRSTLAAELAWRWNVVSYVSPRAIARDLFGDRYAGNGGPPAAGWLWSGGTRMQVGLAGAHRLGSRLSVQGRAGMTFYPGRPLVLVNPMLGQLPFHLTLGVGRTW